MKKLILSVIILVLTFGVAHADVDGFLGVSTVDEYLGVSTADEFFGQTISSGGTCDSCNTGTDGKVVVETDTGDADHNIGYWYARQFTNGATWCITGVFLSGNDDGNGYDVTGEIYTDSSGEPGSIVDAGYTGTYSNIPDTSAEFEITFAATQTLSAGTYWMVFKPSNTIDFRNDNDGVTTWYYSNDSGSSWNLSGTSHHIGGVLGCIP